MLEQLRKAFGIQAEEEGFEWYADSGGLLFVVEPPTLKRVSDGGGSARQRLQLTVLRMLAEQGDAEEIAGGYRVPAEVAVALDDQSRDVLDLPERFSGVFVPDVRGHTQGQDFEVRIQAKTVEGVFPFRCKGPLLCLTENECYLQTKAEHLALNALSAHQDLGPSERTESENVFFVAQLQGAQRMGMALDLAHFDDFVFVDPDRVRVTVERQSDGSLKLTPNFGEGVSPDDLNARWGQLGQDADHGVLRVRDRIVLLDEERLEATREVLSNRHIPKSQVEDFLKQPSAYIDASKIDLDSGFSVRVEGVGPLEHISIGDLSEGKRDWFDTTSRPDPPEVCLRSLETEDDVASFESACKQAWEEGAEIIHWGDERVDVSDVQRVEDGIKSTRQRIQREESPGSAASDEPGELPRTKSVTLRLQESQERRAELVAHAKSASLEAPLSVGHLARTPFPHQKEGITWLSELITVALDADPDDPERLQGALLADDMGLGKTFMTLAGLDYYYTLLSDRNRVQKPMLVVAPLSLLSNWEEEVGKTFEDSPFRDIVVLQSSRDLKTYRFAGAKSEGRQVADLADQDIESAESKIRYALKIGKSHGTERLDRDRRLVITTYQTLRDYQFSLCRIDWGMVVFDEAQHIKNPNVLQTRAAKALKADFKLLATGTPVENSLADFWCLLDTAQPGLFGEWSEFREEWLKPLQDPDIAEGEAKLAHGRKLRDAVGPFMLRRTKEDELKDLPSKTVHAGVPGVSAKGREHRPILGPQMSGFQLQTYNAVLDEYRASAAQSDDARGAALSTLHKLRQISLHPRLTQDAVQVPRSAKEARQALSESGKTAALVTELDRIRQLDDDLGRKVIVFLVNKALQTQLKLWLDAIYGLDVSIINGDTKSAANRPADQNRTRAGLIRQFEAASGFNVIIMSPLAAGTGLTVVEANHVVHLERHWNPAKEAQATDRVYRIGQKRNVHIYLPAVLHPEHDSFDVHLDRLLAGKMMLKDAVVVPEAVSEEEVAGAMGL